MKTEKKVIKEYEVPLMQVETLFADSALAGSGSSIVMSKGEGYVYDDEDNE